MAREPGQAAVDHGRTPSIVNDVSAMLVARMTLRRSAGRRARSCSSPVREPWSGKTSTPSRSAQAARCRPARRISSTPGKNARTSPGSGSGSLATASSIAPATCSGSGAEVEPR